MMRTSTGLLVAVILMVIPCQCAFSQPQPAPAAPLAARVNNPMAAYFPEKAKKAKMSGVVIVACNVRGDGNFEACRVVREMPVNYGFGAATAKMVSEIGKADLKVNKPGDVVQATIKWTFSPDQ